MKYTLLLSFFLWSLGGVAQVENTTTKILSTSEINFEECAEPEIIRFKKTGNSGQRKFKVVVDNDINYKSKPSGADDYSWELGSYNNNSMVVNPSQAGSINMPRDTDNDGIPDFRDLNSSTAEGNDINTLENSETLDADQNGIVDDNTDTDLDGIMNSVDVTIASFSLPNDFDGDGILDEEDDDDDNDGILDSAEMNGSADVDTDGDGSFDRIDLDSDNDGISDIIEVGLLDQEYFGAFWDLTSVTPLEDAGDDAKIRYSSTAIYPTDNNDFGSQHGILKVKAENEGADDIVLYSDATDENVVEVFYDKDALNPDGGVPNWFYYWTRINHAISSLDQEGMKTLSVDFSETVPQFILSEEEEEDLKVNFQYIHLSAMTDPSTYAFTSYEEAIITSGLSIPQNNGVSLIIRYASSIDQDKLSFNFGKKSSKVFGHLTENLETEDENIVGSGHRGVYCFGEVLEHEQEHWRIFQEFWGLTGYKTHEIDGTDLDGDMDDYPTSFEISLEGMAYGFCPVLDNECMTTTNDSYTPPAGSSYTTYDAAAFLNVDHIDPNASPGANYEEIRCRIHQETFTTSTFEDFYKIYDWSQTSIIRYQGKNW